MNKLKITRDVTLNISIHQIIIYSEKGSKIIKIEPIVCAVLKRLIIANGIISREELIETVWDGNTGVGEPALTKNIYKIRKIFKDNNLRNPIETIPKIGYRLRKEQDTRRRSNGFLNKKTLSIVGMFTVTFVLIKVFFPQLVHMIYHNLTH